MSVRTCRKCGKEFKLDTLDRDGKRYRCSRRVNCFECNPIGSRLIGFRRYSDAELREAVANSFTIKGVLERLGLNSESSGNYINIKKNITALGINTSHFGRKEDNLSKTPGPNFRLQTSDILKRDSGRTSRVVRNRIISEKLLDYKCVKCGNAGEWEGDCITLELDHINGDRDDNRLENLRFLCPNCHSQTETFAFKKHSIAQSKRCQYCGRVMSRYANGTVCRRCFVKRLPPQQEHTAWPTDERLTAWVKETPVMIIAKELGVSGNAVAKRCKKRNIGVPGRGYWQKKRSDEHKRLPDVTVA